MSSSRDLNDDLNDVSEDAAYNSLQMSSSRAHHIGLILKVFLSISNTHNRISVISITRRSRSDVGQ